MRPRLFVLIGSVAPLLAPAVGLAATIDGVRHRPAFVAESSADPVEFELELAKAAQVDVLIYDGRDVLVRRLSRRASASPGQGTMRWDLRDALGRPVPPGAYHYRIEATTESGARATWDLTDTTGGDRVQNVEAALSEDGDSIGYVLPVPSLVRVRIGLADHGPLLRTLVDWVPRMAGEHDEAWDGRDQSDVIDIAGHERLAIQLDAVELPKNTILVGRPSPVSALIPDLPEPLERRPALERRYRMHDFLRQAMDERRDVPAALELASPDRDEAGRPIVAGTVAVRLTLAPEDLQKLANERFEAVFFVDGLFAFEVESGYFPITWRWNAGSTEPGVHFVTANLRGYEGHFAIATVEVVVEPTPEKPPRRSVRPSARTQGEARHEP